MNSPINTMRSSYLRHLLSAALAAAFMLAASITLHAAGLHGPADTTRTAADTLTDQEVAVLMKSSRAYTLVVLNIGPNRNQDSATADRLHRAHLRYLYSLHKQGRIIVLGPVAPGDTLRGICIYNTADQDEVRRLVEHDPGVRSGRLVYKIHPWRGNFGKAEW